MKQIISTKTINAAVRERRWIDGDSDVGIRLNIKNILRYNESCETFPLVRELFCQLRHMYRNVANPYFRELLILNAIYTYGFIEGKRAARQHQE